MYAIVNLLDCEFFIWFTSLNIYKIYEFAWDGHHFTRRKGNNSYNFFFFLNEIGNL
jgi:hypothetical protein